MSCKPKWTSEVQQLQTQQESELQKLVANYCTRKWVEVANQMNEKFPGKQRTSKQCREKYVNHVLYHEGKSPQAWTEEDENVLFQEYVSKGSKWKYISTKLQGKSENAVKNRFYGKIRKLVRKLNIVCKERIRKSSKPIKDSSIMRIIDTSEGFENLPKSLYEQSLGLKAKLLELAKSQMMGFADWNAADQQEQIQKFNISSRYFCSKKRINSSTKKLTKATPRDEPMVQAPDPEVEVKVQAEQPRLKVEDQIYKKVPVIQILATASFGSLGGNPFLTAWQLYQPLV